MHFFSAALSNTVSCSAVRSFLLLSAVVLQPPVSRAVAAIKSTGKYRREDYGKVTEEGIKILVIYSVCVYIEGK